MGNKILRYIFVQNSDLILYEKCHNVESYYLYGKSNIITYVRGKQLE